MRPLVIDASVMVGVLVEETTSPHAHRVVAAARDDQIELHAPELLVAEVGNALWKRARQRDIATADALDAIREMLRLAHLELHPLSSLGPQALALALAHGITVYDACYVALATALGGTVVSADARLADRAEKGGLPVERASAWSG